MKNKRMNSGVMPENFKTKTNAITLSGDTNHIQVFWLEPAFRFNTQKQWTFVRWFCVETIFSEPVKVKAANIHLTEIKAKMKLMKNVFIHQ